MPRFRACEARDHLKMPVAGPGSGLLADASSLIRRGWTQHAEARDLNRRPVDPWSDDAVCWSLLGALVAALERRTPTGENPDVVELAAACVRLAYAIEEASLESWNDAAERTQADVLDVLVHALAEELDGRDVDGAAN
jgi:hypothetical protein